MYNLGDSFDLTQKGVNRQKELCQNYPTERVKHAWSRGEIKKPPRAWMR